MADARSRGRGGGVDSGGWRRRQFGPCRSETAASADSRSSGDADAPVGVAALGGSAAAKPGSSQLRRSAMRRGSRACDPARRLVMGIAIRLTHRLGAPRSTTRMTSPGRRLPCSRGNGATTTSPARNWRLSGPSVNAVRRRRSPPGPAARAARPHPRLWRVPAGARSPRCRAAYACGGSCGRLRARL